MEAKRQNGAAVLIGILVAGLVAGVFIVQQAGPSAPSAAPAAARPTAAVESDKSESYAECVAYMESIGYDPSDCVDVEAMYKSASADPARDPELAINQPPVGCMRDQLDQPGVFVCSGESESPAKEEPDYPASCRADRAALGMDVDLCSNLDAEVSLEARIGSSVMSSSGPEMRLAGFQVASEFSSRDYSHAYGLQWPGGELAVTLDASNARIGMSLAADPGTRYYSLSQRDRRQRSTVAPGNYIIWVEPAEPKAPLAAYSLTVSAPQ